MSHQQLLAGSAIVLLAITASAMADDNMERLQDFKTTGTSLDIETVPQDGEMADQLRENLERIKLPQGFKIDLYAIVPDARHMAVGTNVGSVLVGTRKARAWVVTDRDKDASIEFTVTVPEP